MSRFTLGLAAICLAPALALGGCATRGSVEQAQQSADAAMAAAQRAQTSADSAATAAQQAQASAQAAEGQAQAASARVEEMQTQPPRPAPAPGTPGERG